MTKAPSEPTQWQTLTTSVTIKEGVEYSVGITFVYVGPTAYR
jgi:hypothetical protein